jgi:N-hydroxyarylamine O-acetyltransferase
MDVDRYLARIQYGGPRTPSAETLRALHRAHLMAVPFEDVDVYLQRPIDLSTGAMFEKIVGRNRGGFCYELNGLFGELLRELGFPVTFLNAEVFRPNGVFGPPFDHLTLLVELDQRWLADVGFPRSSLTPLLLDSEETQTDGQAVFRIAAGDRQQLELRTDDGWVPQFRFDLEPRSMEDYHEMCVFHATSPESPFYRWLGCTIATPNGRVTLSDDKLIEHAGTDRTETMVAAGGIAAILQDRFGLTLDHDWTAPARSSNVNSAV